ncbi:hypothetical protein [Wolbachia endosymbiont of Wuchereria bancrofti]|uniref:hypothetical protein n=1 Tax=Wolbachia endosymbiont of Wuchereria bancrofti TaxID=96496 RepID=UPI000B4DD6F4|nr:hypothetical protein [Wolbachia endosymbiont of Wuchereria bancrofti]
MLNFLQCYFEVNKKLVIMQVTTRLSLQCLFMSSQCVTLGPKNLFNNWTMWSSHRMISAGAIRDYARDLLKSTSFPLDPSATHWDNEGEVL